MPGIEPDDRYPGIGRREGTDIAASRCRQSDSRADHRPIAKAIVRIAATDVHEGWVPDRGPASDCSSCMQPSSWPRAEPGTSLPERRAEEPKASARQHSCGDRGSRERRRGTAIPTTQIPSKHQPAAIHWLMATHSRHGRQRTVAPRRRRSRCIASVKRKRCPIRDRSRLWSCASGHPSECGNTLD